DILDAVLLGVFEPLLSRPVLRRRVLRRRVLRRRVLRRRVLNRRVLRRPVLSRPILRKSILRRPVAAIAASSCVPSSRLRAFLRCFPGGESALLGCDGIGRARIVPPRALVDVLAAVSGVKMLRRSGNERRLLGGRGSF